MRSESGNHIFHEQRALSLKWLVLYVNKQFQKGPDQLLTEEEMEALVEMLKGKKNRERPL
ncbi:hypothetical protein DPMN_175614 [Dreissena polymorpha]|uniref:Uncharacterized protein n=1 Tax=Dreissena polymorpha TaxID=45954 RepID=A0A9D4E8I4_DREPO|nr:hypothetical protein DPMN_175614 [Dreissena polymorpha]